LALVFGHPPVSLTTQPVELDVLIFLIEVADLAFAHRRRHTESSGTALGNPNLQHNMTVRVDTLDALISGSSSRAIPFLHSIGSALLERLNSWRQRRSALVMSDEWLQEYRWSNRDQY